MQKGIIGKKLGMTQLFDANGKVVPVTIIEAGPCTVVQKKTVESDGYQAVQMGYGEVSAKKVNKAAKGHFDKADVAPKRTLREFRLMTSLPSTSATSSRLMSSQRATRWTLWAFPRARATRALSSATVSTVCVRATAPVLLLVMQVPTVPLLPLLACSPASACPGHMGFVRVTVQNLTVVKVDTENNLIAVKGAVPGSRAPSSPWPTA